MATGVAGGENMKMVVQGMSWRKKEITTILFAAEISYPLEFLTRQTKTDDTVEKKGSARLGHHLGFQD